MGAQPIINHPSTPTSPLLDSEFIMRAKHEQHCWTSALLRKRDGLVSRARALALERRQDVVHMGHLDMMENRLTLPVQSDVCITRTAGTFGHLGSLI